MLQNSSKKILVSLTTWKTDWREIIKDLTKFEVTEIGFFPTWIPKAERRLIYEELKKSTVKSIPLVHMRTDMDRAEYDFLAEEYGAKVFNVHDMPEFLEFIKKNPDVASTIYVENGYTLEPLFFDILKLCGGLCIDLAHFEDFGTRQNIEGYNDLKAILRQKKIGMTHIGAIFEEPYWNDDDPPKLTHESHTMQSLSDLDYLKDHIELFAEYNAIELTNSIEEQLKVKEYIETNILGK